MDYFANQNRVQLANKDTDASRAGEFVLFVNNKIDSVVPRFRATVRDIRPIAVDGEKVYHESESQEFRDIVNSREFGAIYGAQVALESDGIYYILNLCNKTTRMMIPTFRDALDESVVIESVLFENGKFSWHGIELWVRASRVQSYIPVYDYPDDTFGYV